MRSGKATFFVANQGNLDALPERRVKDLADETEALNERNKALAAEIKAASTGTICVRAFCSRYCRRWKNGAQRASIYMLLTICGGTF
jgi:hypothetical protein